ncbi:hypothetical protein HDU87_002824 [Geranomyces variabilis]|uniref:Uncharacterized protein n=1 Tax=Geranomyces variabilis TaxID=109894 RepID=A0AAD5TKV8_9FUNG|nr:hypothetical protein HDU87_002824 [Geranomyces variabilis]
MSDFSPLILGSNHHNDNHHAPGIVPGTPPAALAEDEVPVPDAYSAMQQLQQQTSVPRPALRSAMKTNSRNGPSREQSGISFREYVTVAYTWAADEYDRTSTAVEPLTKNDLIELLLYRAEMQQYTRELLKLRKHTIEAERRFNRQREIAAIQAYQRCSLAAAAAQLAATSGYSWDHAVAAGPQYGFHHQQYQQHHPQHYHQYQRGRGYAGTGGHNNFGTYAAGGDATGGSMLFY